VHGAANIQLARPDPDRYDHALPVQNRLYLDADKYGVPRVRAIRCSVQLSSVNDEQIKNGHPIENRRGRRPRDGRVTAASVNNRG
jgi:hypothetical protein